MAALDVKGGDGILTLTLNMPGSANALAPDLVEALIAVLEAEQDAHLIVLCGAGRHFCAGLFLNDLDDLSDGDVLWRILRIEHLLQLVHHSRIPVLALGQGQLVGAGADLFAAACFRVATYDARFKMPGWNFELALGTRRLAAIVGTAAARDMLIDSRSIDAGLALQIGLATELVDREDWPDRVEEIKNRAANLSSKARGDMLALTTTDTRDADFAAIIKTAGRPGLKDRIAAYRTRAMNERKGKLT